MNREKWLKEFEHKKSIKRNSKKFKDYLLNDLHGDFRLFGQYRGYNELVALRCTKCRFVIDNKTPLQFKRNPLCPVCNEQVKQTEKSFIWRLQNLYGNQYILLSDFINVDTFVYLYHKDCGKVVRMRPTTLLSGSGCHYCYGTDKLGLVEIYRRLHIISNDLVLVKGESVKRKIEVRYISCGHKRESTLRGIKANPSCPICSKRLDRRLRALDFAENISIYGLVSIRSEYVNQNHKIGVKCNNCGYEWDTNPNPLVSGHGCPKCHSSRGESMIAKVLDNQNISYEYPKKFKDLRAKRLLHYDFYLPDYNVLIEYQGGQHYKPVNYFGGEKKFIKQQKYDQMKRNYAKENGYRLLEIPYTCYDIESIKGTINNFLERN